MNPCQLAAPLVTWWGLHGKTSVEMRFQTADTVHVNIHTQRMFSGCRDCTSVHPWSYYIILVCCYYGWVAEWFSPPEIESRISRFEVKKGDLLPRHAAGSCLNGCRVADTPKISSSADMEQVCQDSTWAQSSVKKRLPDFTSTTSCNK